MITLAAIAVAALLFLALVRCLEDTATRPTVIRRESYDLTETIRFRRQGPR